LGFYGNHMPLVYEIRLSHILGFCRHMKEPRDRRVMALNSLLQEDGRYDAGFVERLISLYDKIERESHVYVKVTGSGSDDICNACKKFQELDECGKYCLGQDSSVTCAAGLGAVFLMGVKAGDEYLLSDLLKIEPRESL